MKGCILAVSDDDCVALKCRLTEAATSGSGDKSCAYGPSLLINASAETPGEKTSR